MAQVPSPGRPSQGVKGGEGGAGGAQGARGGSPAGPPTASPGGPLTGPGGRPPGLRGAGAGPGCVSGPRQRRRGRLGGPPPPSPPPHTPLQPPRGQEEERGLEPAGGGGLPGSRMEPLRPSASAWARGGAGPGRRPREAPPAPPPGRSGGRGQQVERRGGLTSLAARLAAGARGGGARLPGRGRVRRDVNQDPGRRRSRHRRRGRRGAPSPPPVPCPPVARGAPRDDRQPGQSYDKSSRELQTPCKIGRRRMIPANPPGEGRSRPVAGGPPPSPPAPPPPRAPEDHSERVRQARPESRVRRSDAPRHQTGIPKPRREERGGRKEEGPWMDVNVDANHSSSPPSRGRPARPSPPYYYRRLPSRPPRFCHLLLPPVPAPLPALPPPPRLLPEPHEPVVSARRRVASGQSPRTPAQYSGRPARALTARGSRSSRRASARSSGGAAGRRSRRGTTRGASPGAP